MSIPLKENRYSRQTLLPEIGKVGQRKLGAASVLVVGCGALGTHASSLLARAGVGEVRIIDRDVVDITNLQRQSLFTETDVGRPKAKVAEEQLRRVNSEIDIEGLVADLNHTNAERLVKRADVVVDATDNMETRFLLNDACVKNGVPWIYGGAVGVGGMVLAIGPQGPCLRCLFPSLPQPGELPTCDTAGIVNTLPSVIASFEVTEAFKVIIGAAPTKELIVVDVWSEEVQKVRVAKDPHCRCCGEKDFEFLTAKTRKLAVSLCGRNAVQIVPAKPRTGGLASIRNRLSKLGTVTVSDGVLRFRSKDVDLTVFPDGRTVVSGTTDLAAAKTAFSKYIGD